MIVDFMTGFLFGMILTVVIVVVYNLYIKPPRGPLGA